MKFDMKTKDLQQDNVGKIEALFHEVVTETKDEKGNIKKVVDFDKLRQILSDEIVEGPRERYGLNWVGKKEALYNANKSTSKTLRPVKEESVDFENTKNIYIEGDNLDALKIIQESYLGKVKMIYIDPPYNTGKDFIYKDNFKMNKEEYDKKSEIIDEEGNKLVQNTESNGRFHSDWLSMMYSRLKVARNLLTDDGVIFISIDDHEVHNLRKIMDEIFGEENFVATFVWQKNFAPKNDNKYISVSHEYIVLYTKNKENFNRNLLPRKEKHNKDYSNPDNDSRGLWTSGSLLATTFSEKGVFAIIAPNGKVHLPPKGRCWRFSKERIKELIDDNRIWFGKDGNNVPRIKRFLSEMPNGIVPQSWLPYTEVGSGQDGTQHTKKIFNNKVIFDFPKPISLIKHLLQIATNKNDIILDFFSGSATTAHAVMELNAEDGGNRQFIMVQLDEKTDEKSEAYKAGYKTIPEIGRERIRRAGKKIKDEFLEKYEKELEKLKEEENKLIQDEETQGKIKELEEKIENIKNLDTGFRTFKVDSSNMKDIYYTPAELTQGNLSLFESKIKEDRTDEDLLIQIILDLGLKLDLKIEEKNINNNKIYIVEDNLLVAYFGQNIEKNLIEKIKEIKPLRVVFDEKAFKSDSTIINLEEEFKKELPDTEFVVF
jgi:adenine-specific DNA-methyltransferase